tara:strand:+ start:195 stop:662 length:468 start_codon:yes stop_codon:yes gene_type:complete
MKQLTEKRLKEIGVILPEPPNPQGSYVPWVISGNLVYLAGQIPLVNGKLMYKGKVPTEVSFPNAVEAAKICAINLVSQLRVACNGELDRVKQIVKIGGFIACDSTFHKHPEVINGASDFFQKVFQANSKHSRFAVGAPSLPLNAPVEIDGIFELI